MLYLLGLGAAVPETIIDNHLLTELNPGLSAKWLEEDCGIKARRSAMPLDYIRSSKGKSSKEGMASMVQSPTDLSFQAALTALTVSGIEKDALGLIMGDCSTPVQTCPSEGQRLGGKLGIKVPAYDVTSASGAFVVHLSTLNKWKDEKIPDYVMGLTSSTTTHTIEYGKGIAGALFGDGAATYIVSSRKVGKLKLIESGFAIDSRQSRDVKIETYGHLEIPESFLSEFVRPNVSEAIKDLKAKYGNLFSASKFIGPQSDWKGSARQAVAAGFAEKNILSNGELYGDMLGASAPAIIGAEWNQFKKGEMLFVVQSGLGLARGHLVFEVVE